MNNNELHHHKVTRSTLLHFPLIGFLSIGVTAPVCGAPDDPDRTVTRSEDVLNEAARQKHILSEATSIRLKLDPDAVPKEDRLADKSIPVASTPTEFLTDGKLQFTDNMYSLGMMQEPSETEVPKAGDSDLAGQATNPVAPLFQLQFQNNFVGESNAGDGYSNAFIFQPVIPWKMGETAILTRITLPLLVGTPDLGGTIGRQYGNGDLVVLNAFPKTINQGTKWQAMVGPVATFTIPTASSDFLGEGKYQAGPGFIYLNTGTKGLQWGIFGYQQWSFASSGGDEGRPEVSRIYFQPIITKHFDKGYYIGLGDFLWTVDFNNNDHWSIPFGIRFGHVTKWGEQPVNLFIEPWWDLSSNNNGNEWGVKLNVTFLFPTSS